MRTLPEGTESVHQGLVLLLSIVFTLATGTIFLIPLIGPEVRSAYLASVGSMVGLVAVFGPLVVMVGDSDNERFEEVRYRLYRSDRDDAIRF